jgi:hypothetical protein
LVKKPELGEAVISVRPEAQYLEFSMAASVQGVEDEMVLYQGLQILS